MIYRVMIMRKILSGSAKSAAVMLLAAFCLAKPDIVKNAVSEALGRCIETVIPSLFAMLIVSGGIVQSGVHSRMPRAVDAFGRAVFGMEKGIFPIFVFSVFAGYPVGARMLMSEYERGHISKRRAELLSGVCFGAGPAFIFGCISGQLYGTAAAGRVILISSLAADMILAMMIRFLPDGDTAPPARPYIRRGGAMMTECVESAGRAMRSICLMILTFSVISSMLGYVGADRTAGELVSHLSGISSGTSTALFAAFLDVTAVEGLPHGSYAILPFICAITSFGGVCVLFQVAAAVSGRISIQPLIIMRLAAAVLSFMVSRIIMPYMTDDIAVAVSSVSIHRESSPVPSVMLVLMSFMVMSSHSLVSASRTTDNS